MPQLIVTHGPDEGRVLNLKKSDATTIGRGDVTHRFDDEHLSRRHSRIFRNNDRWYIADLDSMNGTFVNGERIDEPVKLREGDQIRIGHTRMEVLKGSAKKSESSKKPAPKQEAKSEKAVTEKKVKKEEEKKPKKKAAASAPSSADESTPGGASSMLADILGDFDMEGDDSMGDSFDPFDDDDDDDADGSDVFGELDKKTKAIPEGDEETVLDDLDDDD